MSCVLSSELQLSTFEISDLYCEKKTWVHEICKSLLLYFACFSFFTHHPIFFVTEAVQHVQKGNEADEN